jgi:IS5 family transposase
LRNKAAMKHRPRPEEQDDLLRPRLIDMIDGRRELVKLAALIDWAVVARWVENPYCQHFTGETFSQHRRPIDPSSLSRWRGRIGEEGVEWLLTQTIRAGQKSGASDGDSIKRVAVDTSLMEKAIAHPTDARLHERAREHLVAQAQEAGVEVRQTYARLSPSLALQVGC